MVDATPQPVILESVDDLVHRATTVLAGVQLDLFTPLKDGPLSAALLAEAIGVETDKLRPLLFALVVAGLLTVEDELFANSAEAGHYLVRGRPSYQGHRHKYWSDIWSAALLIAESIRTGTPQAKHDYANMTEEELEEFLHGLYPWSFDAGTWLAQISDSLPYRWVLDAGGGSGALAIVLTEAPAQNPAHRAPLPPRGADRRQVPRSLPRTERERDGRSTTSRGAVSGNH